MFKNAQNILSLSTLGLMFLELGYLKFHPLAFELISRFIVPQPSPIHFPSQNRPDKSVNTSLFWELASQSPVWLRIMESSIFWLVGNIVFPQRTASVFRPMSQKLMWMDWLQPFSNEHPQCYITTPSDRTLLMAKTRASWAVRRLESMHSCHHDCGYEPKHKYPRVDMELQTKQQ